MGRPSTSRTELMTYRLTVVINITIMPVWQSMPCNVNNKSRVEGIFEDYFMKHRADLEIIFSIKRCFHLHSHISTLKEEKECSSETLVTIYQNYTTSYHRRDKPWGSPISQTQNILMHHVTKSVIPETIGVKIILCFRAQIFFYKLEWLDRPETCRLNYTLLIIFMLCFDWIKILYRIL
jgi:hypothetical protein